MARLKGGKNGELRSMGLRVHRWKRKGVGMGVRKMGKAETISRKGRNELPGVIPSGFLSCGLDSCPTASRV